MKKIHETLYKTPEMIKLFIVFCLFIYFLMDIVPARESMMEIIGYSILSGLGIGLLTTIYMKPKSKKKDK
ncbi:hypothetical protein E4T89_02100 [Jeotgalicoccus nanhaiensis]|nr:hypothetical protein E4T89_02100 [Jeotgalicoccus nanhaiensis]